MDRKRLNPTDLYKATGISRETIYAIKDGRRLPSIDVLERLGAELGVSPGQLADGALPEAHDPNAKPAIASAFSLFHGDPALERLIREAVATALREARAIDRLQELEGKVDPLRTELAATNDRLGRALGRIKGLEGERQQRDTRKRRDQGGAS